MIIAEIMMSMIEYSNGNLHDINHFLKVYALAKTIGEKETISQDQQRALEIAALVHDIACPLCREKYGNTNGKFQEAEGEVLAREFLLPQGVPQELLDRVVYLVAHHHTYTQVDGMDYQILLEADYLVNACESKYSEEAIKTALSNWFKTDTGIQLLKAMYLKWRGDNEVYLRWISASWNNTPFYKSRMTIPSYGECLDEEENHGLSTEHPIRRCIIYQIYKKALTVLEEAGHTVVQGGLHEADYMKQITWKKIDEANFLEAFHLKLAEGQERFVSHPIRSLAQAYVYYNQCTPFGIYADDQMVGYVMVIYDYDVPEYDIWHMMIDEKYQGKGYGKAGLAKVIAYIKTKPFGDSSWVALTCNQDNLPALKLYAGMGFAPTGNSDDDEIELVNNL